jgi:hypothetical protein
VVVINVRADARIHYVAAYCAAAGLPDELVAEPVHRRANPAHTLALALKSACRRVGQCPSLGVLPLAPRVFAIPLPASLAPLAGRHSHAGSNAHRSAMLQLPRTLVAGLA